MVMFQPPPELEHFVLSTLAAVTDATMSRVLPVPTGLDIDFLDRIESSANHFHRYPFVVFCAPFVVVSFSFHLPIYSRSYFHCRESVPLAKNND